MSCDRINLSTTAKTRILNIKLFIFIISYLRCPNNVIAMRISLHSDYLNLCECEYIVSSLIRAGKNVDGVIAQYKWLSIQKQES